eukprot:47041-Eustigmatos_ZCMA.PRE.1
MSLCRPHACTTSRVIPDHHSSQQRLYGLTRERRKIPSVSACVHVQNEVRREPARMQQTALRIVTLCWCEVEENTNHRFRHRPQA